MLDRINIFIGSLVLSLVIVFGAMYAAVGTWTPQDFGIRTASSSDAPPQPASTPQ